MEVLQYIDWGRLTEGSLWTMEELLSMPDVEPPVWLLKGHP